MQLKSSIKIGILFTLIILIFIGGYTMFKTLKHNKQVFEQNLEAHIPLDASIVVKVNNKHDFSKLLYFLDSDSIINQYKENLTYPLYLITKNNKHTILAKVTSQQEEELKVLFKSEIFPYFSPKITKYKNSEILLYTTIDNSFYTCSFFGGIFAGSYDFAEIQSIIDLDSTTKIFFDKEEFKTKNSTSNTMYPANIFIVDKNSIFVLNTEIKADSIILTGEGIVEKTNSEISSDSTTISSYFSSLDNSMILPSNIYSNSEVIFNNNVKCISSYFRYENDKLDIKIIANKN